MRGRTSVTNTEKQLRGVSTIVHTQVTLLFSVSLVTLGGNKTQVLNAFLEYT